MAMGRKGFVALALGLGLLGGLAAFGQPPTNPNERHVSPGINVEDDFVARTGKLWALDFTFKDPRTIPVNIPGKGTRVVTYLRYQVINYTSEPRTFIPDFELVTHDKGMVYTDQILPSALEAIRKLEDPTGHYKIKSSVTISAEPIPVSVKKADPRVVTGVATWIDPNEIDPDDDAETRAKKKARPKLADSNRYSIFVAGLSNGFTLTDDPAPGAKGQVVRRKTLQLTFQRMADKFTTRADAMRFRPPATWIYRASKVKLDIPAPAK
jgi:hypothetical protein